MKDANQEEVRIKQLSVDERHKTLGCHKDPVGNQIKQLQVLQDNIWTLAKWSEPMLFLAMTLPYSTSTSTFPV